MDLAQVGIFIFSTPALWLVSRRESWGRWGYIAGLAGQPFWFYTTIKAEQWGIVALCCFYTYSWLQGIYNFWWYKETKQKEVKNDCPH